MKKKKTLATQEHPIPWLPIDSRLITPIFKFGSVTGVAKFFLQVEISLAIIIVIGTLIVAALKIVSLFVK